MSGDTHAPGNVTRLLSAAREGQHDALEQLMPLLYEELRLLAERQLGREHGVRTLAPTDLLHEAYFKLARGSLDAENRSHFLAIAARAMRQVLVEQARRRRADKRGGDALVTTLGDAHASIQLNHEELIALDDALQQLEERQRRVVELRYFAGLDEREVAEVLGVTERTVRRDWVKARAWLFKTLYLEST